MNQKKPPLPATTPAQAAAAASLKNELAATMELLTRFGKFLETETQALRKADFKTVDQLQDDKKNLAKSYHTQISTLSARKAELAALDLPTREKLVLARKKFTEILNDNLHALAAAKDSSKRLVDRILEAAREAALEDKTSAYTARGRMNTPVKAPLSISLNRQL